MGSVAVKMKWNWFDMVGVGNSGFLIKHNARHTATIAKMRQDQFTLPSAIHYILSATKFDIVMLCKNKAKLQDN